MRIASTLLQSSYLVDERKSRHATESWMNAGITNNSDRFVFDDTATPTDLLTGAQHGDLHLLIQV